jgi:hypothetical protein
MTAAKFPGTVLAYTIHNGEPWWRHVGNALGFEDFKIVSCIRGDGDFPLVDDFYPAFRRLLRERATQSDFLSASELDDVIARCRVLRWLPRAKAAAMALAMAEVMDAVLETVKPVSVVSWPIDRYVSDVLARRALAQGIPYFEITESPLLGRTMMIYRGQSVEQADTLDADAVEAARVELTSPLFTPPIIRQRRKYTAGRFWKMFGYFRLRGIAFKAISLIKRDPLNLHYVDAQAFLGHKPRLGDYRVLGRPDADWKAVYESVPRERRLFLPLQVFPEASIDYWINDLGLVQHEDLLVDIAETFSRAGYVICVKDHPLQFGFRQLGLIDRLKAVPNVTFAPYDVNANDILARTGVTFTCTGTLGMQSSMIGLKAVAVESYCSTKEDFVLISKRADVAGLPARVAAFANDGPLEARQSRIAAKLLRSSFPGDFISIVGFRAHSDPAALFELAANLGEALHRLGTDGQDWHGLRAQSRNAARIASPVAVD